VTEPPSPAADPKPAPPPPKPPNNWVGVGVLAIWLGLGVLLVAAPSGLAVFGFVMVGWILAVMAHEFSHAAVAWFAGDKTVAAKGYLSFDPRRYGDLGVTLVIPIVALALGGIGFPGGAVYLRQDLMRGPLWRAAASLAGPAATLAILLALSLGLHLWAAAGGAGALFEALTVLAFLQAMALVLNLLPIPGLDGFGAIRPFLPAGLTPTIRRMEGLVMVVLLLIIFYVPGASAALIVAAALLSHAVGLDIHALQAGWTAFHFWRPHG
jgi:Zn-dependent protease